MAGYDEYVEFYLGCNPPLLLSGVGFVIQGVQPLIDDDIIAEILYEPDVPCFKCISTLGNKTRVTRVIQSLLLQIFEEETQPVDAHAINLIDVFDRDTQPDLEITSKDPRAIAWSAYKTQGKDFIRGFDHFCYPDTIRDLNFKSVWRRIEDWEAGNFEKLLMLFRDLIKDENVPLDAEGFAAWSKCEAVSHNLKGNLLYLGSDESEEVVAGAIETLNHMLALVMSIPRPITHFVIPGHQTSKLMYRWMSHVGLSRTTYAFAPGRSLTEEYRCLLGAATLRSQVVDSLGRPHADKTVYYSQPVIEPNSGRLFKPFENYTFPPKNAQGPSQARRTPSKQPQTVRRPASLPRGIGSIHQDNQHFRAPKALETIVKVAKEEQEEDLITFESDDECDDGTTPLEASTLPSTPIADSQDLICFDSEPEPLTPVRKRDPGAVLDVQAQHNGDPDAIVLFGLMDEEPKYFHRTMGQQAGRTIPNTRTPSASNEKQEATQGPKWSAVAARNLPGGPPTPMIPLNDSDQKWPRLGQVHQPSKRRQEMPRAAKPETAQTAYAKALEPDSVKPQSPHPGDSLPNCPKYIGSRALAILKEIKLELRRSAVLLKMAPGKLSLDLVFGRIYLKRFSPSQVFSEAGPLFDSAETQDFLNSSDFRQDCVGFSPFLTTADDDANRISEMRAGPDAKWRLMSTQTWYNFGCVFNDGHKTFSVQVDADTLQFGVQEARQELLALFLHCPLQAWDMKIRATRVNPMDGSARHRSFSKALVAAMSVSFRDGSPVIGTPGEDRLDGRIEGVHIRQTARYSSTGTSQLSITMVTAMEAEPPTREGGGRAQATRGKTWVRRAGSGGGDVPCRWFEVSITSTRVEKMFEANEDLKMGQVATWDESQLESGGILDDLCVPGISMIQQMDDVGWGNNNEQRLDARDAFRDDPMEPARRRGQQQQQEYCFW